MGSFRRRPTWRALTLALVLCPAIAAAQSLANAHLRADFGPRGMTAITGRGDARTHRLRGDEFAITLGARRYESESLAPPVKRRSRDGVAYRYRAGGFVIDVSYELKPGWRFVSKQISLTPESATTFRVDDVTLFRETLDEAPVETFTPGSARPSLGTLEYGAALRFADHRSL
ncbi:MAG TPA: hypothetical protein VF187_05310, partial [Gemmatimonadales bacterium]